MASHRATLAVHQLKVQLDGMKPPIWRRLVVPSELTLGSLHDVIQVAFGWHDGHLHDFTEWERGGRRWGAADGMTEALDEEHVTLADVLPRAAGKLAYTYDFGDDWRHTVTVEQVRAAGEGEGQRARCTGGRRGLPCAEDLGGVWGLSELLDRYAAGDRPRVTSGRDGDEMWEEYDSLHDEVLADLYETGFDPAAFDPGTVDEGLSAVRLRRGRGSGRSKAGRRAAAEAVGAPQQGMLPHQHEGPLVVTLAEDGRPTVDGRYLCECGQWHPLPGADEEEPGPEALGNLLRSMGVTLPAVRLPAEAELARAVRDVPAFMAAVRLGHWCAERERALTPKGVLRPALARQAVEEAELWRVDPEEWGGADPAARAERAARLGRIRSAGDMELVDLPWEWARGFEFVETDGSRAVAGPNLPALEDDASLLAAWNEAAAGAAAAVSLAPPEMDGMLGSLSSVLDGAPPLVFLMLLAAYGLEGDEWLDVADHLRPDLAGLPGGSARDLMTALVTVQYTETAETLAMLGAAQYQGGGESVDPTLALLGLAGGLPLPESRFRLTALGRSALHCLMGMLGITAPRIGALAQADAGELLSALPSYRSSADIDAEVAGWLARRRPADAAVQVIDACAGMEPGDALRRLYAPLILDPLLRSGEGERAAGVLRKAAVSGVDGCAHTAASMLRRLGRPVEGGSPWGLEWMLVDGMLPYQRDPQSLRDWLTVGAEGAARRLDQVAEHAEMLWRSCHPRAADVLTSAAEAVRPLDKGLAKRLRQAAFKARSIA